MSEPREAAGVGRPVTPTVIEVREPALGLQAFVALDSVALGPAAGGIRTRAYGSVEDAAEDARALAAAMTVKCALGGLRAGGGKAVVMLHDGLQRAEAFRALGRRIEALGGWFRTAGDLGTTVADLEALATTCSYVHTDEQSLAASVAQGHLRCIQALCRVRGREVAGLRVAVQGCGAIGGAVARVLTAARVEVVLADVDGARAASVAEEVGGAVVAPQEILLRDVDVVAPCAVGGVVTTELAEKLRAWAVCGAANNVLADDGAGAALQAAEVWLVPDVVASAGAVVDGIGRTVMGMVDRTGLIDALGETAELVLRRALETGEQPTAVARALAAERIAAAG